jgi:hypothetical protein
LCLGSARLERLSYISPSNPQLTHTTGTFAIHLSTKTRSAQRTCTGIWTDLASNDTLGVPIAPVFSGPARPVGRTCPAGLTALMGCIPDSSGKPMFLWLRSCRGCFLTFSFWASWPMNPPNLTPAPTVLSYIPSQDYQSGTPGSLGIYARGLDMPLRQPLNDKA